MEPTQIAPALPPPAVHHVNHLSIVELAGNERRDGVKIERLGRTEMLLRFAYMANGQFIGAPIIIVMSADAFLNLSQAVFSSAARLQAGHAGAGAPDVDGKTQ